MSCFNCSDPCSCNRIFPAFLPISRDPYQCQCCQCVPCPPVCDLRVPSYAFYYTTASQAVAAGAPVVFGTGSSTPDIVLSGGNLLFTRPGVYLIQYHISVTAPIAGVTLGLALNGVPVAGSAAITTTDTHYSGQAIVSVPAGGVVSLTVSGASTISSASITAVRISC
ncbi:BclA C-terminal domain-containing protein [Caproicibacter sp.]|uniref:BclA C-terminal domain-containing protein n=1 Tax=Caproicibacter sp. TaxID=2814884 RepID=UPI0039891500